MQRKSKPSLDKTFSKLAAKYPKGIYKHNYYCGYGVPAGNLLSKKEVLDTLAAFDGMSDHSARQKFADLVISNPECRALFVKRNGEIIKNWFDGLLRSKKDREAKEHNDQRKKLRIKKNQEKSKRRQEQEQRRVAAAEKLKRREQLAEEKRNKLAQKLSAQVAAKQDKLWQQLQLTDQQRNLLKQLSELKN